MTESKVTVGQVTMGLHIRLLVKIARFEAEMAIYLNRLRALLTGRRGSSSRLTVRYWMPGR